MSNSNKKAHFFSALVNGLNNWNRESNHINDLSKLKVLKLLFLGVSTNKDYLNVFDNFVAWDLGPVEKDIYDLINQNNICGFEISSSSLERTSTEIDYSKEALDFAEITIDFLKSRNPSLIKLSASSLVDITHKWNCWNLARNYQLSVIPADLILSERGYYS